MDKRYYKDLDINILIFKSIKDKSLKTIFYNQKIEPVFDEMIENIINVYEYGVSYKTRTEFKSDCLGYLQSRIKKIFNQKKKKLIRSN